MQNIDQEEFLTFLGSELTRRIRQNPRYSLRSFAKHLGIEPSFLSKILTRKRKLTTRTIDRMSQKLGISMENKESALTFSPLNSDQFALISDWYHFAILELTELKNFSSTPASIASKLGISKQEAKEATERLIRLGHLSRDKNGTLRNSSGRLTTTTNPFTTVAFRNLQRQILQKAIEALDQYDLSVRDQSSITVATNENLLPEAKRRIQRFRRSLLQFLDQTPKEKNSVYNFSLSLYPVTTIHPTKEIR